MPAAPRRSLPLLTVLTLLALPALALDLKELIRDVEEQYNGRSSHARATMQVKTEHWERNMEMEAWSLGRDYFLVRILEPPKERGVSTLKAEDEVWNYLPKVDRVIKIPPSMMGGSWMGSHITNNDLVKAAHVDEDYAFTLLEETETVWRVEGLPKPDAAVVWGRIVYVIEKEHRVPRVVEYFDEEGVLVREIRFDDVQTVDDRVIPLRMTVQPTEEPDEQTTLHYREIAYDIDVEKRFFSLRSLKGR